MKREKMERYIPRIALVFFVFVLSLSGSFAHAAVFYVTQDGAGLRDGSSWANACGEERFQLALSEAPRGIEFWVAEGRYRPGRPNRPYSAFILPPGVSLYGGFSGFESALEQRNPEINATILTGDLSLDDTVNSLGVTERTEDIVGQNSYTVLRCEGDPADFTTPVPDRAQSVIDGFVITAGNVEVICYAAATGDPSMTEENPRIDTGGLHVENANVVIRQCSFVGNAGFRGGGVFIRGSASRISQCTFSSNHAFQWGGGIHIDELSGTGSDMTVTDCVFTSNSARDNGGGISSHSGGMTVRRCTFAENAAGNGGGIHNYNGTMTVESCAFSGNSATGDAHGSDIRGGGIYNQASRADALVENCTFYGNSADFGGGVANFGQMVLRNCTLSENSAAHGEELADGKDYHTEAVNCIFWHGYPGDEIYTEQSYPVDVTYSIVKGGYPGDGNLDSDPLLGTAAWNGGPTRTCALLPGSPAIDSGNPSGAPGADQRGIQRPQKSGYDRGAYEVSLRKFLVMRTPFSGAFRFSTEGEEFPSGEGTAWGFPEGRSVTVTFLPEEGKAVKDVLVDGKSMGAVRSYAFPSLDRDHEIEVLFADVQPASGGGGCSAAGAGFPAVLLVIPAFLLRRRM